MKSFLLTVLFLTSVHLLQAQAKTVANLPAGRYITLVKEGSGKWSRGDIILIDDNRYKITGETEEGDYRTSITAQRIFFTSGPLRGAFARLMLHNSQPAIELPLAENSQKNLAATDVIAIWKP